jgi:tight adherence protein B
MTLIIVLVFITLFAVTALLIAAMRGSSAARKQFQASLASALRLPRDSAAEETVDIRKEDALSSISWMHRLLSQIDAAVQLQSMLDQADLPWNAGRLVLMSALVWVVSAWLLNLLLPGIGILCLILTMPVGAAPFIYVRIKRRARFLRFLKVLPDVLDLMVSALVAGHSLIGALGIVASDAAEPVRREFRLCFEEQNFGVDLHTAMDHLRRRVPIPDVRIIATAILIQKESGGNLAEVLERTAQLIRERFRLQDQIRVHTAQSRLNGILLTVGPLAIALILSIVNPGYLEPLFHTALGHKMMAIGAGLNLLGLFIIRSIIRIRV